MDVPRHPDRLKPERRQKADEAWLAPFHRFWFVYVDSLERHLDQMDQTLNTAAANPEYDNRRNEMKIKVTSIYVDDQSKALAFYTDVLGFAKKNDFSQGPYRWLTVVPPDDSSGVELQLALNNNPAAKTYQEAIFQQGQPAIMFFTDDVKADYERIKGRGAQFTMPPTEVPGSTIAKLNDTCGNLIQLTQLAKW